MICKLAKSLDGLLWVSCIYHFVVMRLLFYIKQPMDKMCMPAQEILGALLSSFGIFSSHSFPFG